MEREQSHRDRPQILYMVALIRDAISKSVSQAFENVFKKDIGVTLSNQKVFFSYFAQLAASLKKLGETIDNLEAISQKHLTEVSDGKKATRSMAEEFYREIVAVKEYVGSFGKYFSTIQKTLQAVEKKEMVVNVPAFPKIEFPKTQTVKGTVTVDNQPDMQAITDELKQVKKAVQDIKLPAFPKIEFPKNPDIRIPDKISLTEKKEILEALESLKSSIENIRMPLVEFPDSISVNNFPPQRFPIPPTNININPLRGVLKATGITVTTTPTPLPSTRLRYRRSFSFYNNSSSVIVYFGGSDVNTTDGIPVPPNSYSPALDAGPNMLIYAVTASSSADVRVLEISNESVGKENVGD